jgi:hypothetical protein
MSERSSTLLLCDDSRGQAGNVVQHIAPTLLPGLSRWPQLVRRLEQASWRRFEWHHMDRLHAGQAMERR